MDEIAIRVENLSKQYRIGRAQQRHDTLREALVDALPRIARRRSLDHSSDSWQEDRIWALKDVSFEVRRGEVVGIIGRNGAGKSTLLKILSRITEPTEGRAEIHGRVGSLLEVGTGFHAELTGRENIYLSGAILGMRRAEIDRRFDEIVDFSGVERFIDTPIKRYSSGMKVRLGFAVAAHLEPEILLVDEVLAVGDAAFQKKCLGKMEEVAEGGRTVLFVSHNMAAIQNLSERVVFLDSGVMVDVGQPEVVIPRYLGLVRDDVAEAFVDLTQFGPISPRERQVLRSIELISTGGRTNSVRMGDEIAFRISYATPDPIHGPRLGIVIQSDMGVTIASFGTGVAGLELPKLRGQGEVICQVGSLPLNQGTYYIRLVLGQVHGRNLEDYERAMRFHVHAADSLGTGKVVDSKWGFLAWQSQWHINRLR